MILLFERYVTHEGTETKIGAVKVEQTAYGTLLTPNLLGLPPGLHGFPVHATGNCGPMEKDSHMVAGLVARGYRAGTANPDHALS
jgi:superoxide dismutase, Cu-Zn family